MGILNGVLVRGYEGDLFWVFYMGIFFIGDLNGFFK